MNNPDIIRFLDGVPSHEGSRDYEVGWTGPWPPPEKFWMAVGNETGEVHIIDGGPEHVDLALRVAAVYEFERKRYSKLDKGPDGSVMLGGRVPAIRGAEYAFVAEVTA